MTAGTTATASLQLVEARNRLVRTIPDPSSQRCVRAYLLHGAYCGRIEPILSTCLRKRAAEVEVTMPATGAIGSEPGTHIHYQVDDESVVATTATSLEFHDLAPGSHTITVSLADAQHRPLGPQQTLTVTIPESASGQGM